MVIQEGSEFWEVTIRRLNPIENNPPKDYLFTLESLSDGIISELMVAVGEAVTSGDQLLLLAENDMKTIVCSPVSGIIDGLHIRSGDAIKKKQVLVTIRLTSQAED